MARDTFGTIDGESVALFTLANDRGAVVRITEYGGTLVSVSVPDRFGESADVVLGFDTLEEYQTKSGSLGVIVGRFANRIAAGRFQLDGADYQLAINNPPNHLHGGEGGFQRALWQGEVEDSLEGLGVRLNYTSADGEDGYPGEVKVEVRYTLTKASGLRIDYYATTDRPTPINLTNHAYFQLQGHNQGAIHQHVLRLKSSQYTVRDASGIPSGEIALVEGTPFDFTSPMEIGARIDQLESGGYDDNLVFDGWESNGRPRLVGEVIEPVRGRRMELLTTEPGVQLYTGNFLDGLEGKQGAIYDRHHAFCLETQHFPDSVNHDHFPSVILRPDETYRQTTEYRFSTL
ncbi:MAG: galactose mutarotase [Gemmatimonadetes bacterium]|nr:galactose mutarotase [Gemmatimonadota bacterium]MBT5057122.1 galactose mutarotase [Gemmatimonadota bacterium]MBT5142138.1 galactose mutarotase [Gemmatimonadota bacterium]MBT5589277.1 galactose mutarotase [Gemmatimonadota bacterium]MBT5963073.1 galactose mutarotase [Gemmatimonadota bacterium]